MGQTVVGDIQNGPGCGALKVKITFYRLLDEVRSFWRRTRKEIRAKRKWGARWKDMTRSGRRYTRVEFKQAIDVFSWDTWRLRHEAGWEWPCPNCKSYSLVTESMMPEILADWEKMALNCKNRDLKIPTKPTAATAGCTNCKYRPGDPE